MQPPDLTVDEEPDAGPALQFDDLYRQWWAPMVRLAWFMTGSRPVAEDVVQDAFIRFEARWETVTAREAYLRRCVVNGVRARHRRLQVEQRHPALTPPSEMQPETEEVWAALSALSDRQRHALILRYYHDLTVDEVARLLGCRPGTAKSLIHRGLTQLKEQIHP